MQKTAHWLFVFLVFPAMLLAQNVRVNSGTSLPATCTEGDYYVKTDAAAGQREYICIATDTWEQQTGGGGGGGVSSVFGRTGTVTANSGDYTASQVIDAFDVTVANALTNVAAPGTPSAGKTSVWSDSADKILKSKNDTGTVAVTVVPDSGAANNFLTGISAAGVISKAQPSCSTLSNAAASCSTDTSDAANISTGTLNSARLPSNSKVSSFGATFDGGGSALAAGTAYVTVPFACTISAINILVDTGTATFTTWRKANGAALPTVSDSISTSGISITSGTALHSTTVSDFTATSISANDIIGIRLNTVSSATWAQYIVECDRT